MHKKRAILLLSIFLLLLASIVNAVFVDKKIEDKLNRGEDVSVIVVLKEKPLQRHKALVSGEESFNLQEKKEMIRSQQEKVFSGLIIKGKNKFLAKSLADLELRHTYSIVNAFSGKLTRQGLEKLKNNPDVEGVYFDKKYSLLLDSSALQISANNVWNLQYNSTNITGVGETICIIDTGIDYNHSALGNGWGNKVIGGYRSLNNGADKVECSLNNSACFDDHGHGTHVAGIAASTNSTYKGIAPDAKLISIKALDSTGSGYSSDIIAGIDWCVNNASTFNISVISMSLGDQSEHSTYCNNDPIAPSINTAVGQNIIVTVAAGNCNWQGANCTNGIASPACIQNATAIGAVNDADVISYQRGALFELLAPGIGITSSQLNGGFTSLSGTSMSAPHAAGSAALLQQFSKLQNGTSLTPAQIREVLNSTGTVIDDTSNSGYNFSRINVYAALLSLDLTPPMITFVSPTLNNGSSTPYNWVYINITSSETLSNVVLEWNSTSNHTMSGSNTNFFFNKTNLIKSNYTYRIFANDSANNTAITSLRNVYVNNSAPSIDSYFPAADSFNIVEPSNQTFNISASDSEEDPIIIYWYLNSILQSIGTSYNFIGNYSAAGIYNITAIVSDGYSSSSISWNMTVNNTNRLPQVANVSIASSDPLNRTNGTLTAYWSFYDEDGDSWIGNETKWYNNSVEVVSLANLISVAQGNTTKGQLWIVSARVYDGFNWSNWYNSSPLVIQNSAPEISLIPNYTVNETETINITIDASDIDNDSLAYFINDTRFNQSGNTFTWQTTITDSGIYAVNITASDNALNSSQTVFITVLDISDSDNDGVEDSIDYLIGSLSSSSTINLSIAVNGSTNLSQEFNGTLSVNFTNGSHTIIELNWTFNSTNKLNLSAITIEKQTENNFGSLLIRGINLSNGTKIVYVDDINQTLNTVCVKDAEIASIDEISAGCNGANEVFLTCDGTSVNGYSCTNINGRYRITGLSHSGIKEQCADSDEDGYGIGCVAGTDCDDRNTNVNLGHSEVCGNSIDDDCDGSVDEGCGGGDSGGRGAAAKKCTELWACGEWSQCVEGIQSRICVDQNNCGTALLKPKESQTCLVPEEEGEMTKLSEISPATEMPAEIKPVTEAEKRSVEGFAVKEKALLISFFKEAKFYIALTILIILFAITVIFRFEKKRHKLHEIKVRKARKNLWY